MLITFVPCALLDPPTKVPSRFQTCACVCVCVCACVRACVRARACVRSCVCACVRACVRECVRARAINVTGYNCPSSVHRWLRLLHSRPPLHASHAALRRLMMYISAFNCFKTKSGPRYVHRQARTPAAGNILCKIACKQQQYTRTILWIQVTWTDMFSCLNGTHWKSFQLMYTFVHYQSYAPLNTILLCAHTRARIVESYERDTKMLTNQGWTNWWVDKRASTWSKERWTSRQVYRDAYLPACAYSARTCACTCAYTCACVCVAVCVCVCVCACVCVCTCVRTCGRAPCAWLHECMRT